MISSVEEHISFGLDNKIFNITPKLVKQTWAHFIGLAYKLQCSLFSDVVEVLRLFPGLSLMVTLP